MNEALSLSISQLIYKFAESNNAAFVFDDEKLKLTYKALHSEVEKLAAGLLSIGLQTNNRVLICGSNTSIFIISSLACARAGLIFSLFNSNVSTSAQLKYALNEGEFRAIICFPASREMELLYNFLSNIAPELRISAKGHTKSPALPHLTHVIMGEEEHKHAGTYTLSEIFGRSSSERINKLPKLEEFDPHKIAVVQFTMGTTGPPKLIALSHYQLINACRVTCKALKLNGNVMLCCALPMFKIPIYSLSVFAPFLVQCTGVIPASSSSPKYLFDAIRKHGCTNLLTNAVALKLMLKIALTQRVQLPTITDVIVIGDRLSPEIITLISNQLVNAKNITTGYALTEVGAIPILTNDVNAVKKGIGKSLPEFKIDIVDVCSGKKFASRKFGELLVQPIETTKFFGYGPNFDSSLEWINTGDIVTIDSDDCIDLITQTADFIYDANGVLLEHWLIEKIIRMYENTKGIQVISTEKGAPIVAVIVLKDTSVDLNLIKSDIQALCKNKKIAIPDKFAFIDDFPRINSKIQRYRLRQMIANGEIKLH